MSDDVDKFMEKFRKDTIKNFTKAGIYLVSAIRKNLNTSQPYSRGRGGKLHGKNPSKPGNFPHKLSGQLQKSITWTIDEKKLVLTVGTNLKPYPALLETGTKFMRPRPWLSLSWSKESLKVIQIATGN